LEKIFLGMSRIRLTIAYDGSSFQGWQSQRGGNTIQDYIQTALLKVSGDDLRITGSGRTDTGVHALGQVAHFDAPEASSMNEDEWKRALNVNLPPTIRIVRASMVEDDFHSRFGAKAKTYRYEIDIGSVLNPLRVSRSWHHPEKINPEILLRACSIYIGEHDFASFAANRKDGKQINTVRTINSVDVAETPHGLSITFSGNGFLYKMVRLLVGAAVRVAEQREELSWLEAMLKSPGTSKCQYCATGEGLYLVEVVY